MGAPSDPAPGPRPAVVVSEEREPVDGEREEEGEEVEEGFHPEGGAERSV